MNPIIILYLIGYVLFFYKNMSDNDYEYTGEYDSDKRFKFHRFIMYLFQSFFKSFAWFWIMYIELMLM